MLAGAIAYVTTHLGIAFTASIRQEHPFNFARRISSLDHASKGRIAWNIVADDPPHAGAEEYVDVTYKLWEGSWEEDALRQNGRADSHAGEGKSEARRKAAELDERTSDAALLSLHTTASSRVVGTPEQIADELASWQDAGVDGVNLVNVGSPVPYEEFVDYVAPVLRGRGLMQREYAEGTLRHKLFGRGDRLPERHPAARYRGAFAPQRA